MSQALFELDNDVIDQKLISPNDITKTIWIIYPAKCKLHVASAVASTFDKYASNFDEHSVL